MNDSSHAAALRLALPSKGALADSTREFFANAGLKVYKPNERQYSASISTVPGVEVVFQRVIDVFNKVNDGSADLGVTGYDVVCEHTEEYDDVVILQRLGFGKCQLVLAVPESWLDVGSLAELADLSTVYKGKNRLMRVATKYPTFTKTWLYERGITHFTLVEAEGALEAAPNMGYADIIVDITSTGTTLRENRLKLIDGGILIQSEACLIGNKRTLAVHSGKVATTRHILELIEAYQRSRRYLSITANMQGGSPDEIGQMLSRRPDLAGLQGPSIARVYSHDAGAGWFAVTIVVERPALLQTVGHLRACGGKDITVSELAYFFESTSRDYEDFCRLIGC